MLFKTPLFDLHIAQSAKTGAFAGYDMPLYYKAGVLKEHEWTRSHVGIFDVSHMGQIILEGPGTTEFIERLTPSAFQSKKPGRAQYTVLMNESGGMVDDLIISRMEENKYFVVLNAGCKEKDIAWINKQLPSSVSLYPMTDHALIALQGRWAERLIYETFEYDAHQLPYMHMVEARSKYGFPVFISRLGYTGEDGFEVSMPNEVAIETWEQLTAHPEALPVGLAARDSLRLEMGYPLYGHDIDETTSPVEAGLEWIIRKDNQNFIGAERVKEELANGATRRRVGVKLLGQGIAREGAEMRAMSGEKIGILTSGGFSPTLKQAIGQGYVDVKSSAIGQKINVIVRDKAIEAEIVPMPFIPAKTKSIKKAAA